MEIQLRSDAAPDHSTGGDISPGRLLVLAGMFAGVYLAMPLALDDARARPGLLAAALVGGLTVGVCAARFAPSRLGASRGQGRRSPAVVAVRSTLVGLTGVGLILAQLLSTSGLGWLAIGSASGMTAVAGHAWMKARTESGVAQDTA